MERSTARHFTETNVQKRIKTKTILSFLHSGHSFGFFVPKQQIRLKGTDVPSCLCVILRRVIITICKRIKVTTHTLLSLSLILLSLSFFSISVVQPSHWVHVSWQCLADSGSKEEERGEWFFWSFLTSGATLILLLVWLIYGCPHFQIIEKRRRDRINHSLSELRRLVPSAFEKQVKLYISVCENSHQIDLCVSELNDGSLLCRAHQSWRKQRSCRWQWIISNCCTPWEEKVSYCTTGKKNHKYQGFSLTKMELQLDNTLTQSMTVFFL